MKFRRITAPVLALAMLALFVSCAAPEPNPPSDSAGEPSAGATPSDIPPSDAPDTSWDSGDITSLEVARMMGYGINLGNTMEACNSKNRDTTRDPSVYETMWGQPVTTQAMVTGMKAAGFDTLRIPVAWTNAMDFENGDYTINEAYLARVEEIINYALNEDMFVIINDHWDHGWWSMFGQSDQTLRDKARKIFTEMWTQIAERYKDYDHRLIFEAANEEPGDRFNDSTSFVPARGTLSKAECYALITEISQVFVDLVRDSGGNNAGRFLLIPGYNTDVKETCDSRYKMPADKAGRLLLSVHYYTPWSYCGDTSGVGVWGKTGEVTEMNDLLGRLTKYTDMGYGVILGEWGVLDNEGADRLSYFTNFLDNCDLYGYVPLLWDTGFLYDRKDCKISAPEIADLFYNRANRGLTTAELVTAARENMDWSLRKAESRPEVIVSADEAIAWIMFNSSDYNTTYSVGDKYNPESITKGIVAVDADVTAGAGTYTVSLDFTGTGAGYANGMVFSAVGIIHGEILFPGYYIVLREVLINGEQAEYTGLPYTTNDNPYTSRVNLYNEYIPADRIPAEARIYEGSLSDASHTPLSLYINTRIESIVVTFEYIEG